MNAVNDDPIVSNGSYAGNEDTNINGTLSVSDIDSTNLVCTVNNVAARGTVVGTGAKGFIYTPDLNSNGSDSFTFTCSDGQADSNLGTININVLPVNDKPKLTSGNFQLVEDGSFSRNYVLDASDIDGDSVSLEVDTPANNGVVVVDNIAKTWTYTPSPNYYGSDQFVLIASDGDLSSTPALYTVNIAAVDDPPVAHAITLNGLEDTLLYGNLSYSDIDSTDLTFSIVSQGSKGSAAIVGTTVIYTPVTNANGSDIFSYGVSDGTTLATAIANVSIIAVNDTPLAYALSVTGLEDSVISGQMEGFDQENTPLQFSLLTTPKFGSIANVPTGEFDYTPDTNYYGNERVYFKASDGSEDSLATTLDIEVQPVNDAPIFTNTTITVDEDLTKCLDLSAYAEDIEDDLLSYSVTYGTNISGSLLGSTICIGGTSNWHGTSNVEVIVDDSIDESPVGNVVVTVNSVNDQPTMEDVVINITEDDPATCVDLSTVLSDVDTSDSHIFYKLNSPRGTVDITGSNLCYTPVVNDDQNDQVDVKACDNGVPSLCSEQASVIVGITPVNDPVVSSNHEIVMLEDGSVNLQHVASDIDSEFLTFEMVNPATMGTSTMNLTGLLTYIPNDNYYGYDVVDWQVCENGIICTNYSTFITVEAVNDRPISEDKTATVIEDGSVTGTVVASDIDGDELTTIVVSSTSNGTFVLDNFDFTYTPNNNYFGSDVATIRICDESLCASDIRVSITITPVNDAPIANDYAISGLEDITYSGNLIASDVDSSNLQYVSLSSVTEGVFNLNSNGSWSFTPNDNYYGQVSIDYAVYDGLITSETATLVLNIASVNDLPVASSSNAIGFEDQTITGVVEGTDVDHATLSYVLDTQTSAGDVVLLTNGNWTYTPNENFNGSDLFSYHIVDGAGGTSSQAIVSITVVPVNDAPLVSDRTLDVDEDNNICIDLSSSSSDVDFGQSLTYAVVENSTLGNVSINGSSACIDTNQDMFGIDTAKYVACDSGTPQKCSESGNILVNVHSVPDEPVQENFYTSHVFLRENETKCVDMDTWYSDVDSTQLNYQVVLPPVYGSATFSGVPSNSIFCYEAPNNQYGAQTIGYTVCDEGVGIGQCIQNTIRVVSVPLELNAVEDVNSLYLLGAHDSSYEGSIDTSYSVVTDTTNDVGSVVMLNNGTGQIEYYPTANYPNSSTVIASSNFYVEACNLDDSLCSGPLAITLNVQATPDAPDISNLVATVIEDQPLLAGCIPVDGTIVNPDNEPYEFKFIQKAGDHTGGAIDPSTEYITDDVWCAETLNNRPLGHDDVPAVATVQLCKEDMTTCGPDRNINVTVQPLNDAPTSQGFTYSNIAEDSSGNQVPLSNTYTDVDGDTVTFVLTNNVDHGTLSFDSEDGHAVYTPTANYNGSDQYTFKVVDGHGGENSYSVNLDVVHRSDKMFNLVNDGSNELNYTSQSGCPASQYRIHDTAWSNKRYFKWQTDYDQPYSTNESNLATVVPAFGTTHVKTCEGGSFLGAPSFQIEYWLSLENASQRRGSIRVRARYPTCRTGDVFDCNIALEGGSTNDSESEYSDPEILVIRIATDGG